MHPRVEKFAKRFHEMAPAFARELERTATAEPETFDRVGNLILGWAEAALGHDYMDPMIEGYVEFTIDVNRSQLLYEKNDRYQYSSFAEVFEKAYSNDEFMQLYHWGVYSSTFVWLHHLKIVQLFEREFLPLVARKSPSGTVIDLGAGSGVWHLLALQALKNLNVTAVDISQPSVERSAAMAAKLGLTSIKHVCADALAFDGKGQFDAGISCFVLEHLEDPHKLIAALARAVKPRGYVFVTGALTAAEIDHIYEFKRESEMVQMFEANGFRVVHMLSSEPATHPADKKYLPRSAAFIAQRRGNDIW